MEGWVWNRPLSSIDDQLIVDRQRALENYKFVLRFERRCVSMLYGNCDGFLPSEQVMMARRAVELHNRALGYPLEEGLE